MKSKEELLQIDEKLLNKRFTIEQLECTHEKAKMILNINNDFKIDRQSFKNLKINYQYLHFLFIDKRSITDISISNDFGNDLYFLMIICDADNLNNIDYNNCSSYIVDDNYIIQPYSFDATVYEQVRNHFNFYIGQEIRSNTSINNITEYITFDKSVVDRFMQNMSLNNEMIIKLILINSDCSYPNSTNNNYDVSEYLSNCANQNRFSLAFQQNPSEGNAGFYDIGNMQP